MRGPGFSAALRCGLIEAMGAVCETRPSSRFSAALRCGLIEAARVRLGHHVRQTFSAALRCGLIEAMVQEFFSRGDERGFPQHYAAA